MGSNEKSIVNIVEMMNLISNMIVKLDEQNEQQEIKINKLQGRIDDLLLIQLKDKK